MRNIDSEVLYSWPRVQKMMQNDRHDGFHNRCNSRCVRPLGQATDNFEDNLAAWEVIESHR